MIALRLTSAQQYFPDRRQRMVSLDHVFWFLNAESCSDPLRLSNRDHHFTRWHILNMDCYALVYSATSGSSFASMRAWHNAIRSIPTASLEPRHLLTLDTPPYLVALVETNCDFEAERQVREGAGAQLAQEFGCAFYRTSSTDGHDKIFEGMGRTIRDLAHRDLMAGPPPVVALEALTAPRPSLTPILDSFRAFRML